MNEKILFEKIMLRIGMEKNKIAIKRKIAIFSVMLAISFVCLIPASRAVYSGFADSGFTSLFSLIFSDTFLIMGFWQNFVLSLLETLPLNEILITGVLSVVFLSSLKFLFNNLKNYEYKQNISIKLV